MILGDRWSYVYVCPHKTGTATMREWLQQNYDGKPHGEYHSKNVPPSHADSLVFMTVRNPYERLRYRWRFKASRGEPMPFAEMVYQTVEDETRLVDWRDATGATEFLRLEDLENEVRRLPFFDPERPMPGHHRKTVGYEEMLLDREDRALVADVFAEDFEAFGYEP